ncbi:hypothetical protein AB0A98_06285 [Streptomyces chrestomyceticus]|uniref:hypothetical protein n=1 Tax=Streptomyces chrestomyceticus TaxID=68185 RepID=UPI0033C534D0
MLLHGAARLEAGQELTELESRLVEPLRRLLSEEEVRDFGHVYQEEASTRARVLPDSLAARPVTEGYGLEDLIQDLPVVREEILAQPNIQVIDLDAPGTATAEGEAVSLDSEGFLQAVAAYGYGATVVTSSAQQQVAAQDPRPLQTRLDLSKFYAHRISSGPGSDEIYWTLAAGADGGKDRKFVTRTYTSVDRGETHQCDVNTVVYNGPVDKGLIVNISCWEEDLKAPAGLGEKIREISVYVQQAAETLGALPLGPEWELAMAFIELAGMIGELIGWLIEWMEDDLVQEHTIAFERSALERMAAQPGRDVFLRNFSGSREGSFDLYIKGTVAPSSNKVGQLTHTAAGWSAPTLPWPATSRGIDAPALAAVGGKLYCAVRGADNSIWVSRQDPAGWKGFVRVPALVTYHAPALAAFNGRLYLAYIGMNDNEPNVLSSADGTTWSAQTRIPGRADTGLTLAVRDNVLHCAYSASGTVWYNWANNSNATSWTQSWHVPDVGTTFAPAMATYQGKLYLAYRGGGGGEVYIKTNTSSGWASSTRVPGTTPASPALGVRGNTLYCAIRGGDNKLWLYGTTNGTNWDSATKIPGAMTTLSGPALAAPNTTDLYLVYRAAD